MPLAATILVFAAMGCLGVSLALIYAAAPRLGAYLQRQTPMVDVPEFDLYAPLRMNRLVWLILTVRLPKDRPLLRNLLIATRLVYFAAPVLMISGMIFSLQEAARSPLGAGELLDTGYSLEISSEPAR